MQFEDLIGEGQALMQETRWEAVGRKSYVRLD